MENYRTCKIHRFSNCASLTCSVVDPDLYGFDQLDPDPQNADPDPGRRK